MTQLRLLTAGLIAGCSLNDGNSRSFGKDGQPNQTSDSDIDSDEDGVPTCNNEGDTLDLRREFPAAPDGGIEIRAPTIEVPPYTQAF